MALRVLCVLALLCGLASAQGDTKPWAKGVSKQDQELALTFYNTANDLYEKGSYTAALANYEAALKAWDHPGIHFNTAMCFKALDRWVEVYEHIQKALVYKDAPLGKDLYKEGQALLDEAKGKVATLEIRLKTEGATVTLGGDTVLTEPGTVQKIVPAKTSLPLVAKKTGYEEDSRMIQLEPNAVTTIELVLKVKERGRTVRRMPRWIPWAVLGLGVVAGGAGVFTTLDAGDKFAAYDKGVDTCGTEVGGGCAPGTTKYNDLVALKDEAESQQRLGHVIIGVGGAVVVGGLILVVINQPRLVGGPTVSPAIGKESAGATVTFSW
jgi:tetratricopeptide (TPR) repeat protein